MFFFTFLPDARARALLHYTSLFDIYSVVFGKNYTSVFDLPSKYYTNYQFFIAAPYSYVFDRYTWLFGTHYSCFFDPVYIRF